MARVDRKRDRSGIPGLELLESRSLLSNLKLNFLADDSVTPPMGESAHIGNSDVSIAPDQSRLETSVPNQVVTTSPESRGVTIQIAEPQMVISGALRSKAAGDELIIAIRGQGILGPVVVASAYLEDGWIVIELPHPSVAIETAAEVHVLSNGSPNAPASPFVSQHQATQQQASKRLPDNQLVLSGVRLINLIDGFGAVHPQDLTDGRSYSKVSDTHIAGQGEGSAEPSPVSPAVGSMFPSALTFRDRSSLAEWVSDSEIGDSSDVGLADQLPTGREQGQPAANNSWPTTQQSDRTYLRTDHEGVVAESVKGIKVRGTYADPASAAADRRVVDLAVIRFEKPIAVRVQLPFALGVQHEMNGSASDGSGDESASAVEAVDSVLSEVKPDHGGLEMSDRQISGILATIAAAVGYFFGSRRTTSLETQVNAASTEPFIPVFSEIQLRRLSSRLGAIRREQVGYSRPSLRLASTTGDGFPSS